ncbi:probable muscarinic acetylcholine receptor gar-1 isoform X1 [Cherax quadricarinatus]
MDYTENGGMQVSAPSIENMYGVTLEAAGRSVELALCRSVNVTIKYHQRNFCDGRMSLALMIAMLVLGFITFFVNLGVMIRTIKILRNGHNNKPAFYFIGNLALSDLAIGLYVVIAFLLHITHKSDLWQKNTCMLQIGVAVTACQETIFTIMLIAVDKYLYICHGLKYSSIVTTKRVYIAVIISWIFSILIGSLPVMGMQVPWEQACDRCIFAQVISRNFIIIFFITSVAGPYAVVVSLYSVLLMLALKMHKARYGGSLTGNDNARSSNFRLSFMSKKSKSSKSNRSTSATTDPNVKANRRRTKRKEVEYTATLPGISERDASAKLIRYQSQETHNPEQRRVSHDGEITEKLIQGQVLPGGDQLVQDEVATDSRQRSLREAISQSDDGAVPEGTKLSCEKLAETVDENFKENENKGIAINIDNQDNFVDNGIRDNAKDTNISVSNYIGESFDCTASGSDRKRSDAASESPKIKNTKGPKFTRKAKTGQKCQYDTHEEPPSPLTEEERPSPLTEEVPPSHLTDEEFPSPSTDEEAGEKTNSPSSSSRTSWLLTKYFNRVVSDTRDKVLFLKKCRALKTVFLIIGSFTATYVPFVVGTLVYSLSKEKHECLLHMLNTFLYCAVVANSLANPLMYAYGYREFRLKSKRFKGIFAKEKPIKIK